MNTIDFSLHTCQITLAETVSRTIAGLTERYLGKDVVIPVGYYKGRKGKITQISFYSDLCVQIQPYRQERRGLETVTTDDLLWDKADARTLWPISSFEQPIILWDDK